MRYYIVYFLDFSTYKPTFHKYYSDEKEAQSVLETVALEHIKNEQGKQQSDIAIQKTKSLSEIQNDETLKEGLYIKHENNTIALYNKAKFTIPGYLYSAYEMRMVKLGQFDYSPLELDIPENCSIKSKPTKTNTNCYTYIDELKLRLTDSKFGLRKITV
jgi:hypothetical protein